MSKNPNRDLHSAGMPIQYQGNRNSGRPVHPDSYQAGSHVPYRARYGAAESSRQHPNGFRVDVSFPDEANQHSGYQGYGRPAQRPISQPYAQPGSSRSSYYYGNVTVIHVGDGDWADRLADAMRNALPVDLIFETNWWRRFLDEYLNPALERAGFPAFSFGFDPSIPARAMLAPLAIVAIVVAALVALVASISLVTSTVISMKAIEHGYEVDIDQIGSGGGSREGGGSGSGSGQVGIHLRPGSH